MASFSLPPLPLISSVFIIRSAISWTWTYNFLHFFAAAKCIGNEIKSDFHVFLHFHFASMLVFAFSLPLAFGFYFYLNRTIIWVKINATQLWKLHWKFVANDDDGCGENECGDSGSHKGPLWFDTQIHRHTHRRRKRHEHENRWRNKASRNENSWRIY